jgi:mono/diheme cytochrome c family protein
MRKRSGSFTLAATALVAAALACKVDPKKPTIHYALSDTTREIGADGEPVVPLDVQDQIFGSLAMLFGTPSNPQYLRTADWIDEKFDPNWPRYEKGDDGSGEISVEDQEQRLWPDNQRAFHRQLAAIEAGHYDKVDFPQETAPDLIAKWNALLVENPPDKRGDDFRKQASELFTQWYPTLRDSAELYRQQCLHCHGSEGGGDGPTADFLNPRPRDYRLGVFKFTALKDKSVPRRADLFRIIDEGVTGTAMPSFRRFSKAQIEGLVDYVRLLSLRGMVERDLVLTYKEDEALPAEAVLESYRAMWEKWGKASEKLVAFSGEVPAPTPESIARGRELFMDATTGNCFSCHGAEGRGNGTQAFTKDPESGVEKPAYKDDWGHDILPRNITQGVFRGGRRPIDIYRRIYSGINGTPMPAIGESKKADGSPLLTQQDLWAIVHYVGTISQPTPHVHAESEHGDAHSDH